MGPRCHGDLDICFQLSSHAFHKIWNFGRQADFRVEPGIVIVYSFKTFVSKIDVISYQDRVLFPLWIHTIFQVGSSSLTSLAYTEVQGLSPLSEQASHLSVSKSRRSLEDSDGLPLCPVKRLTMSTISCGDTTLACYGCFNSCPSPCVAKVHEILMPGFPSVAGWLQVHPTSVKDVVVFTPEKCDKFGVKTGLGSKVLRSFTENICLDLYSFLDQGHFLSE